MPTRHVNAKTKRYFLLLLLSPLEEVNNRFFLLFFCRKKIIVLELHWKRNENENFNKVRDIKYLVSWLRNMYNRKNNKIPDIAFIGTLHKTTCNFSLWLFSLFFFLVKLVKKITIDSWMFGAFILYTFLKNKMKVRRKVVLTEKLWYSGNRISVGVFVLGFSRFSHLSTYNFACLNGKIHGD